MDRDPGLPAFDLHFSRGHSFRQFLAEPWRQFGMFQCLFDAVQDVTDDVAGHEDSLGFVTV